MLVTVVRVDNGQVSFAPHTPGASWLVLDLVHGYGSPQVGEVGDLEWEGDDWLFEALPGHVAILCEPKAVGPADDMTYRFPPDKEPVSLAGYGVPARLRDAAARLKFWRLDPPTTLRGHFNHPDLAAWADDRARQKTNDQARKARGRQLDRRRSQREYPRQHFVNPYTFVPFSTNPPQRARPAGHHTLAADSEQASTRYQGRITARLATRSPLLVRNVGSAAPVLHGVAQAPRTAAGRLFLPGSSLHGALRSLHETLTGSCLRVFDPDFVPVYRDVASGELREGWGLGVVEASDGNGRPTRIVRCSDTKWVELDTLARDPVTRPITTGQRFRLNLALFTDDHGRDVYPRDGEVILDPQGDWVVLVTDDAARSAHRRVYCAVGRIPSDPTPLQLTDRAWARFQQAAEGSKQSYAQPGGAAPDLTAERDLLAQEGTSLADVLGAPMRVRPADMGRWLRPRPWLHPGQVVWLAPTSGRSVGEVALSYLWRTAGRGPAGGRLPTGFEACHDPEALCPSCRIFGSADTREVSAGGVDRRLAEQRSYRGHVRVLDAVLESGGVLDEVSLPATGAPRAGSGQFYLDDPHAADARLTYQQPRNRWGGAPDKTPRRLRGRKFYWHTDPAVDEQRKRWSNHNHRDSAAGERVELVAAGSRYRVELLFDGLTASEIGGLVATLQPGRLFATQAEALPYPTENRPEFAIHLGGGKPIGLGSCQVDELTVTIDTCESRYLRTTAQPHLNPDELVSTFAAEHAEHLADIWQNVAAALHTDHVDSRIVSYPTPKQWADENGSCGGPRQHESFSWFQNTTGEDMRKSPQRPFIQLPPVSDIAQGLPIDVQSDGRSEQ